MARRNKSVVASLSDVVPYTDRFLRIREIGDWDNALNGLQIENSGRVTRMGAAVDVSTRVCFGPEPKIFTGPSNALRKRRTSSPRGIDARAFSPTG